MIWKIIGVILFLLPVTMLLILMYFVLGLKGVLLVIAISLGVVASMLGGIILLTKESLKEELGTNYGRDTRRK